MRAAGPSGLLFLLSLANQGFAQVEETAAPTPTQAASPADGAGPRAHWIPLPTAIIRWTALDYYPERYGLLASPWALAWSDLQQRDCTGNLCGPQSLTLRTGMTDQTAAPSAVSPILGGIGGSLGPLFTTIGGSVVGPMAVALKPGPPHQPTAGPDRDGWLDAPRGLWRGGSPFSLAPLLSAENREGGIRVEFNW